MPRTTGHVKGATGVKDLVENCAKLGIKYLTLFAFSKENWQRPVDEVSTLMELFIKYLDKEVAALAATGVCFKVIGDVAKFPIELQTRINAAKLATKNNQTITLTVAANYSGRWDIVKAVQGWQSVNPTLNIGHLTENLLAQNLSTVDLPDVDLIIRTGGERRLSNFLLWQMAYSELYFTDVLWPDFNALELEKALLWYAGRERRYGRIVS